MTINYVTSEYKLPDDFLIHKLFVTHDLVIHTDYKEHFAITPQKRLVMVHGCQVYDTNYDGTFHIQTLFKQKLYRYKIKFVKGELKSIRRAHKGRDKT